MPSAEPVWVTSWMRGAALSEMAVPASGRGSCAAGELQASCRVANGWVGGLGPRANVTAWRAVYVRDGAVLRYSARDSGTRRRMESDSSQVEACKCDRDLRANPARHTP